MTPKLLTTLTFSLLFSLTAVAAESVEPIPTVESADVDFEQDAARKKKKKKKKSTRSNNGQSQQEGKAQERANQKQRDANKAENRADQAQKEANQAQRRANQVESQGEAQGRSPDRNSAAQRRSEAERRDEAARRAARHRNAQPARSSNQSSSAVRPHRGGHATGSRKVSSPRWHHGWHSSHSRPVRWYHGVFVYGPNVHHHNRVRRGYYTETSAVPMPSRKIDRDGAFSVGLSMGTYASGYDLGGDFSDFGMGVTARFRPVEGLGFELTYSAHDNTFDSESSRTTTTLAPSIQAFVAPWSRISPYASVGVTFAERAYNDTWTDGFEEYTTQINDSSFGPHVGIGLEIALGQNAALNFEARAIGFLDNQRGGTIPGALQSTFGAQWYF